MNTFADERNVHRERAFTNRCDNTDEMTKVQ
jgi:hypothetical protein